MEKQTGVPAELGNIILLRIGAALLFAGGRR